MGTNNINNLQVNTPNPAHEQVQAQNQAKGNTPAVNQEQTGAVYNLPNASIYPNNAQDSNQQVKSELLKSYIAISQNKSALNTTQGLAEQPMSPSGVSELLKSYVAATKGASTVQTPIQVQKIDAASGVQGVWQNNLKQQLRGSKSTILAVIPRTMNAKDTDGNGLIQGNEVRGTFMNAIERLDEIKDMGINTLHVLPIHPPGKQKAMGIAGSLYAPADLLKVDPALKDPRYEGSAEDQFKIFINEAHKRGISVMLDLPSCVSLDFAEQHPELMAFEKDGNDKTPGGWQDIRMFRVWDDEEKGILNPHLLELHKKYVDMCIDLGVDGIRADVGRAKPAKFWNIIIDYARQKDPNFGWLSENYTYEDASPQLNMPHDRPVELLKAGFDSYYGQWHIFDQMTTASDLRNYINQQVTMQKEFGDKEPRTLIGSFSTHDDQSPMFYGGSPWVQFTSILQSTIPLCNPYFVDGVQSGDYYLYPYEGAFAPNTDTDTHECVVHKGRIDIFNPSRKPGGKNPEIGQQISNILNLRNGKYNDVITKGSMCWLKPVQKNDEIIAFARQYGNKTLLVVGNRNVNKRNTGVLKISDLKAGQELKDLTIPYGEKSRIQTENGKLNLDLGPSRIHVFEIAAPNIEQDSFDVSKFVNGVYTKVK